MYILPKITQNNNKIERGEKMEALWQKTERNITKEKKELNKEAETEVCVIGGGITGISTAYALSKEGRKAIILERDTLANKVTGNTTAKITSEHRFVLSLFDRKL